MNGNKTISLRLAGALVLLAALGFPSASHGGRDAEYAASSRVASDAETILARAVAYLRCKQGPDGAWRSETYGLLKSGQSLTPFVLHALSLVPSTLNPNAEESIRLAMAALRRNADAQGVHGRSDPDLLDYPNYATAYALRCFLRHGDDHDLPLVRQAALHLLTLQFSERDGFGSDSTVHGGWGFGITERPTFSSFVDLSHTRRVLQALREADLLPSETRKRALRFLAVLQNHPSATPPTFSPTLPLLGDDSPPFDGGFHASPNVAYANKGRSARHPRSGASYFRSYATATADGILALLAAGAPPNDPKVRSAARWLRDNEGWNLPSGIPAEHHEPWAESMRYYHLAVRAEAYASLNEPGPWRQNLVNFLSAKQRTDGSFLNPEGKLMKEDDPILTTTYAVLALAHELNEFTD